MGSAEVRFGFFAGVLSIIWTALINLMGWGESAIASYVDFFILAVAAYLAVKEKREVENGVIPFGKAFISGLTTCFVVAVMIGAYAYVFVKYVEPQLTEQMVVKAKKIMEERKVTAEEMKTGEESIRGMYSPNGQFMMETGSTMVYGLFISLVVAAFMSRKKKELQQS